MTSAEVAMILPRSIYWFSLFVYHCLNSIIYIFIYIYIYICLSIYSLMYKFINLFIKYSDLYIYTHQKMGGRPVDRKGLSSRLKKVRRILGGGWFGWGESKSSNHPSFGPKTRRGRTKNWGNHPKKWKKTNLSCFFLVLCGVSLAPHWSSIYRDTLTENSPVLSSKSLCLCFWIVLYRWVFWRYCPWILTLRDNWGDCNVPRSKEDLPTMSLAKGVVKNSFDHVKVLVKLYIMK